MEGLTNRAVDVWNPCLSLCKDKVTRDARETSRPDSDFS